jgi:cell filamentation protein
MLQKPQRKKPMRNSYQYIDPDYTYTDPKTGVLRNLMNITDKGALVFLENNATGKRAGELQSHPIKIKDIYTLFDIHKYLFQDVYEWAGKKRTVEISKSGKQFFPINHFSTAFAFINTLIEEYRTINNNEKEQVVRKLAFVLDSVNELHPFREGNGRSQREFIRTLALEKGYSLNLNPPDNIDVYERYMSGTINGDVEKLAKLIGELLCKTSQATKRSSR